MAEAKGKTSSRPKPKRAPLSADRIVEAAIQLMDAEGLQALTMRRLGADLSVEAMSLYRHFPNKESLLEAIGSALFSKIETSIEASENWRDHIQSVMLATYRLVETHPCFVDILFTLPRGLAYSQRGEADLAVLQAAGLTRKEAGMALQSLVSFVVGSLHQHHRRDQDGLDEAFRFGLAALLDGFQARASQAAYRS